MKKMRNSGILGLTLLLANADGLCASTQYEIGKYEVAITTKENEFDGDFKVTFAQSEMPGAIDSRQPATASIVKQSPPSTRSPSQNNTEPLSAVTAPPSFGVGSEGLDTQTWLTLNMDERALTITSCEFEARVENARKRVCKWKNDGNTVRILFDNGDAEAKNVYISYVGKYEENGLNPITSSLDGYGNKTAYRANFKYGGATKVLPCQEDAEAFFQLHTNPGTLISDQPLGLGCVTSLSSIAFIMGQIVRIDQPGQGSKFKTWGMVNYKEAADPGKLENTIWNNLSDYLRVPPQEVTQFITTDRVPREMPRPLFIVQSLRNFFISSATTSSRRQSMMTAISHQLAFQYFGIRFASEDAWLNAGLATLFSHYAVDEFGEDANKNRYRALDQFVVDQLRLRAFEADGFGSSPALAKFNGMTTTYDTVLQDPILYSKGASIVKTLMAICGKEKFLNLLPEYTRKNTRTIRTFAEAFATCFHSQVKSTNYLLKWQNNAGYPLVHVTQTAPKSGTFQLTQERFLWNDEGNSSSTWSVLVDYVTNTGESSSIWLHESADLETENRPQWIVLNRRSTGYYRVNYNPKMWDAIIDQLANDHTKLHPISRAQLIDDVFSLARSTRNYTQKTPDYKKAFRLLKYLQKETEYLPLKAAFNAFDFLDAALVATDSHKNFRAYAKTILTALYKKFPMQNDEGTSHLRKLMTMDIASWACKLGVEQCLHDAKELWDSTAVMSDLADIKEVIYCSMVRYGGKDEADTVYEKFKESKDIHEKLTYINALGCTRNTQTLATLLEVGMDSTPQKEYLFDVFASSLNGNPENVKTVLRQFNHEVNVKASFNTDLAAIEKLIQLTLRKLNLENAYTLREIINILPKNNPTRDEAESVIKTIEAWDKKKRASIKDSFTNSSRDCRAQSVAVIMLLSTIVTFANKFFGW